MIQKIRNFLPGVLFVGLFLFTGCQPNSASSGPTSWIDFPHNNMAFDMQMITIISHSNDPGGLSEVEVSANGTVIQLHAASGTFAKTTTDWYPDAAGNYVLRVRARNTTGTWGSYAEADVTIGGATPTLIPTITSTGIIPSDTPTPAPAAKGELFFKANRSANQFYYGSCGTNSVTIQAYVSDTSKAKDVLLFVNLKDRQSGATIGWDGGESMKDAGNGWFQRTVQSTSIEKYNQYASSLLLYQFVVTGADGKTIGKSQVYSDIALTACAAPPSKEEQPPVPDNITPVRKPPIQNVPLIPNPK